MVNVPRSWRKDHPVADAFFGVDNTFLTRALDAGIFEPYARRRGSTFVPEGLCRPMPNTG